jgi:hypothetical protein
VAEAADQRLGALLQRIRELGDQARAELEWGRENLAEKDFKRFHRETVDALNKQVEELVGVTFERYATES